MHHSVTWEPKSHNERQIAASDLRYPLGTAWPQCSAEYRHSEDWRLRRGTSLFVSVLSLTKMSATTQIPRALVPSLCHAVP